MVEQQKQKLEVETGLGWCEVNEMTFRSWIGGRKLNGSIYHGPVYGLGTDEIVLPYQSPEDRALVAERQTQEA